MESNYESIASLTIYMHVMIIMIINDHTNKEGESLNILTINSVIMLPLQVIGFMKYHYPFLNMRA